MKNFQLISPQAMDGVFDKIGKQWMLITAKGKDGVPFTFDADSVILSLGYKPAPLVEKGKNIHVIGDACKVGNLRTVIWQAWDVCMKL